MLDPASANTRKKLETNLETNASRLGQSQSRVLNPGNVEAHQKQKQDLYDRIDFCEGIIKNGNFEFMPVDEKLLDTVFNSGIAKYKLSQVVETLSTYHLNQAARSFELFRKFKPDDAAARDILTFIRSELVKTELRDFDYRGDFEAKFSEYQRKEQDFMNSLGKR